jgi:hypothetical protein
VGAKLSVIKICVGMGELLPEKDLQSMFALPLSHMAGRITRHQVSSANHAVQHCSSGMSWELTVKRTEG